MQKPKFNIGASINQDLYEKLVKYAKANGKSISSLVKDGVKQIDVAAAKGGPYFRIIKMAVEHYAKNAELTRWSKTFLRGIEMPVQREAHPTAMRRIINRIKGRAVPKDEKANISDLL